MSLEENAGALQGLAGVGIEYGDQQFRLAEDRVEFNYLPSHGVERGRDGRKVGKSRRNFQRACWQVIQLALAVAIGARFCPATSMTAEETAS